MTETLRPDDKHWYDCKHSFSEIYQGLFEAYTLPEGSEKEETIKSLEIKIIKIYIDTKVNHDYTAKKLKKMIAAINFKYLNKEQEAIVKTLTGSIKSKRDRIWKLEEDVQLLKDKVYKC